MYPQLTVNFVAVFAAVVASFVFGFAWYGPMFGDTWRRYMNLPEGVRPSSSSMFGSAIINLFGTFLIAFVMSHSIDIWRPSIWNIAGRADEPFYFYGFNAGLFVWLGFFVPMLLNAVAWESRSWKLFGLNAGYHFINLQIISMILAVWH